MARPRQFDTDQVAAQAMACFREHGYAATSIRELEDATGLRAASLYNAFGNKASLFATALARYRTSVLQRRIDEHLRPELGLDGVRTFFSSTYLVEPDPEHGCLLATTAVELHGVDRAARELVHAGLTEIKNAFVTQLTHCQDQGSIDPDIDVDVAAQTLLVTYEGMLLLARARQTLVDHGAVIDALIDSMRPTHNPS